MENWRYEYNMKSENQESDKGYLDNKQDKGDRDIMTR